MRCLVGLILLAGCADLTVRVEVLNPKYLESPDAQLLNVRHMARQAAAFAATDRYQLVQVDLRKISNDHLDLLVQESILDLNDKEALRAPLFRNIDLRVGGARRKHEQGLAKYARALALSDPKARARALVDAEAEFRAADQSLGQLKTDLTHEFEKAIQEALTGLGPEKLGSLLTAQQVFEGGVTRDMKQLRTGIDIGNDPLASLVVAAPDEHWASTFNRAYGTGVFGNTDVAIKLESAGTFSIKGCRLDASKVTQAAFQAIKQGIQLLAATQGVPVSVSKPEGGTETDPYGVGSAEDQRDRARARELAMRLALVSTLNSILAQRAVPTDDDQRETAIGRVRAAVTSLNETVSLGGN